MIVLGMKLLIFVVLHYTELYHIEFILNNSQIKWQLNMGINIKHYHSQGLLHRRSYLANLHRQATFLGFEHTFALDGTTGWIDCL